MKKLIILLLMFAPLFSLGQSEKKISKKLNLEITNRGLDLDAVFVPVQGDVRTECPFCCDNRCINNWKSALFISGLETGDYFTNTNLKDTENREMQLGKTTTIRGRYALIFNYDSIEIKDANNNFKTAAILNWGGSGKSYIHSYGNDKNKKIREFIISQLIKSNR